MSLLKPATNQTAFLKAGFLGFQGSGKTFTACQVAMGLCELSKKKKVAFYDTEAGSDYMIPKFKEVGLELFQHKGRAFADLCTIIREAEKEDYGCLIIDSISHVWRELMESYQKRFNKKSLTMYDWGIVKGQWQEFTDLYLNSKLHILMLGRAGYIYDNDVNEDTGKKEITKVGTKMKVEAEMGYEPSLLVEMEMQQDTKTEKYLHVAYIIKDRTDRMNGVRLVNPTFKDFKPIIDFLQIGGTHSGIDTARNSKDIFDDPDRSWEEKKRTRAIALERLQELFILNGMDGRSTEAIKKKTELLKEVFGSSSKTYIEEKLHLKELEVGIKKIEEIFVKELKEQVANVPPSDTDKKP